MQILNSLVPIFSVIGLGIILRKRKFLSEETTQTFNRFAYFFALPLFLFYKIGEAPAGTGTANLFLTTLLIASVLTALASWGLTHLLGTQAGSRGALIQASFRGNLAFMGLPLVLFTIYELPEDQRVQIETAVLIALAPVVIFYNVASVAALAVYNQQTQSMLSWTKVLRNIVLNPLLIACVAGLIVRTIGWTIPTAPLRTCEVVGASAFPLALLGIGSQLASITVSGQWTDSLIASGLKCILCPLIGWLVARWVGLVGIELQVIVIMCAMPTAVSSYVLADQMKGDADLAASAVVIGTAISFVTLSILLAFTF
jgi:predicted permease